MLAFILHLTYYLSAMSVIEGIIPWKLISLQLNSLLLSCQEYPQIQDEKFPRQDKEPTPRPLPEDFAMKGLVWVAKYFPTDWYSNDKIDDDEKYFEVASMTDDRKIRILWLGCRIAKFGKWLTYDEATHQFGVAPEYEVELDNFTKDEDILVSVSEAAAGPTSQASTLSTFSATISGSTSDRDDEDMMDVDEALSCKPIIRQ